MKRNGMYESDDSCVVVSIMSELDEDINKLSLRINNIQEFVFGKVMANNNTTLSKILRSLEGELGLKQKEKSLLTRICSLEECTVQRIVKLEDRIFERSDLRDKLSESLLERLRCLEKALGSKKPSSVTMKR
eukprot:6971560-Ditylum_brightwellii.AAC.1